MKRALASVIVVALLGGWMSAQTQTPPRDALGNPTSGTAILAGHVMSDDATPHSLRRAIVQLTGGNLRTPRLAMTDDDGGFAVTGLAPGQYLITVTKMPYLQVQYGQRRPGRGNGTPVALAAGQRLTSIVVAMPRGAVISGTLRDAAGRPAANFPIRLFEVRSVEGERQLVSASVAQYGITQTDDRGMYRLYAVPPGDYAVSAMPLVNQDLRVTESEEINWSEQQWQSARGGGAAQASAKPPTAGRTVGYCAVYFPGTTDPSSAMPISVTAGEERLGVDIALQLVPTAKIEGIVMTPDGRPAPNTQLTVVPITPGVQSLTTSGRSTDQNGKFSFPNLAPGLYRVSGRTQPTPVSYARADGSVGPLPPNLWTQTDVTVNGRDVSDVSLTLQPAMTVTGRVVMEGATDTVNLSHSRIALTFAGPGAAMSAAPSMIVDTTGEFALPTVAPGRYRVTVTPPPAQNGAPWVLKSAVLGGKDLLDTFLEVRPGENVSDLVVTFTNRPAELSGLLLDGDAKPAAGYWLVVFSTDKSMWTQNARRTRQVRPAADGKFVASLPAGEYYMTAVTDVVPADLYDWRFLADLAASAVKVTLADGDKKRQDLKLAK